MASIDHAGARLFYRIDGKADGPPLVLLNSLGSGTGLWDPVMPALGAKYRVLRTDKRGHGQSTGTPGDYSMPMLAADVLAVMDAAGFERATVGGISIGGMISMQLALIAPERVERLIISNSSAFPGDKLRSRMAEVRENGLEPVADGVIRNWFSAPTVAAGGPYMEAVRATFISGDPQGYIGCCAAIIGFDLRPSLAKIGQPALVIAGLSDASLTPEHSREIAAGLPDARLVELPALHIPFGDMPAEYARAVLDFLGPENL
jgi:3-oxoadipate enol-lactonase